MLDESRSTSVCHQLSESRSFHSSQLPFVFRAWLLEGEVDKPSFINPFEAIESIEKCTIVNSNPYFPSTLKPGFLRCHRVEEFDDFFDILTPALWTGDFFGIVLFDG